jgi:hypothetical protein
MRSLCRSAAIPITIAFVILAWPTLAASNTTCQSEIGSCFADDDDMFSNYDGVHAVNPQPLRLAFDETTRPKKLKKRKLVAPVDPTTGIIEEETRRMRSRGSTTTGTPLTAPKLPAAPQRANQALGTQAVGGGTGAGTGTGTGTAPTLSNKIPQNDPASRWAQDPNYTAPPPPMPTQ